jgi:hypothetical protein
VVEEAAEAMRHSAGAAAAVCPSIAAAVECPSTGAADRRFAPKQLAQDLHQVQVSGAEDMRCLQEYRGAATPRTAATDTPGTTATDTPGTTATIIGGATAGAMAMGGRSPLAL